MQRRNNGRYGGTTVQAKGPGWVVRRWHCVYRRRVAERPRAEACRVGVQRTQRLLGSKQLKLRAHYPHGKPLPAGHRPVKVSITDFNTQVAQDCMVSSVQLGCVQDD